MMNNELITTQPFNSSFIIHSSSFPESFYRLTEALAHLLKLRCESADLVARNKTRNPFRHHRIAVFSRRAQFAHAPATRSLRQVVESYRKSAAIKESASARKRERYQSNHDQRRAHCPFLPVKVCRRTSYAYGSNISVVKRLDRLPRDGITAVSVSN